MSAVKITSSALFDAQDQRKLAEAALRSITLSTSRVRGGDFFRVLVQDLAHALDVNYVIAGELVTDAQGRESHRTLAVWAGTDYMDNITYDLADTPCRNVADQEMCYHAANIQQEYPLDTLLVDMHAQSYIGMPMVGTDGHTLGLLVALDTRPMDEDKRLLALSLLSIFSARCAAELQHRRREAELEALVQRRTHALEEARDLLLQKEKLAALGSLVAGVAHVTNTPVGNALTTTTAVAALAQQLREALRGAQVSRSELAELAERIQEGCQMVEGNLHTTAEIISNFRMLASTDTGWSNVRIGLAQFMVGLGVALQSEFQRHHATLSTSIDPALQVELPAEWLSNILTHLLMNALLHGVGPRRGGQVHVNARAAGADGRDLELRVIDNGQGASAEVLQRMFEPFYTTRLGQGGSGLGLHLVYNLVQRMNGRIGAQSPDSGGLVVELILPGCVV